MTEIESADRGSAMTDVASSHGLYRIAGVRHARTLSVYRMSAVKRISRDAHTLARSRGAWGRSFYKRERARRNSTREEMKIRTLVYTRLSKSAYFQDAASTTPYITRPGASTPARRAEPPRLGGRVKDQYKL